MPSPLGRVPPKGAGEVCRYATVSLRDPLFRQPLRAATFPRGEGYKR